MDQWPDSSDDEWVSDDESDDEDNDDESIYMPRLLPYPPPISPNEATWPGGEVNDESSESDDDPADESAVFDDILRGLFSKNGEDNAGCWLHLLKSWKCARRDSKSEIVGDKIDSQKSKGLRKCQPSYNTLSRWRLHIYNHSQLTELKLHTEEHDNYSDDRKALNFRLICSLHQLRILSLQRYGLMTQHVTSHIGCLTRLTTLDLSDNRLDDVPYGLKFCKELTWLGIENNRFTFLPFILTELPNLFTIMRDGNYFNNNYHFLRTSLQNRIQVQRIEVPNEKTVPSLFDLAKTKVLSSGVIFKIPRPIVPDYLLESVCSVPQLCQCDKCSNSMTNCVYKFLVFPANFRGLCMPPVQVRTCSNECAEWIMASWDAPYNDIPPAGQNVEVARARETIGRLMRRRRFGCKSPKCKLM